MSMYNLLKYESNYSTMSSGLWNYYRDEINDDANANYGANYRINNSKTRTSKSFAYKTKLIGSIPGDNNILDEEVVVPLKYLSNFGRSLDLPLINCEIEFDLSWSKKYIIFEISIIPRIPQHPDANVSIQEVADVQRPSAKFQINNAKLDVTVVTLSVNDSIKFLENIKQVFKRTISWNKFRSEISKKKQ